MNVLISYNVIDSNNIQNDPINGGSGINFTNLVATTAQNSIVTGNIIRANLWGVTISPGSRAKPNLGNLSNADTTDDGKNLFINNTNASTPFIDLYNNTIDNIMAENNYWNTNDPAIAEQRIFHQVDNASLGLVDFDPIATAESLPVVLVRFDAVSENKKVKLYWQTATEENAAYFNIQRSADARSFATMGKIYATGNTNTLTSYEWNELLNEVNTNTFYYRLEMVDKDGRKSYSSIKKVALKNGIRFSIAPNPATRYISVSGEGKVNVRIMNMAGQVLQSSTVTLPVTDLNISMLKAGVYSVNITDEQGASSATRLIIR
jgi:hypothetical protein